MTRRTVCALAVAVAWTADITLAIYSGIVGTPYLPHVLHSLVLAVLLLATAMVVWPPKPFAIPDPDGGPQPLFRRIVRAQLKTVALPTLGVTGRAHVPQRAKPQPTPTASVAGDAETEVMPRIGVGVAVLSRPERPEDDLGAAALREMFSEPKPVPQQRDNRAAEPAPDGLGEHELDGYAAALGPETGDLGPERDGGFLRGFARGAMDRADLEAENDSTDDPEQAD